MTDNTQPSQPRPSEPDATEVELLISRLADEDATIDEWRRFRALADASMPLERNVWRELGVAAAEARAIRAAFDHVADSPSKPLTKPRSNVLARIGAFGGWGIAAAIAIVWIGSILPSAPRPTDQVAGTETASFIPVETVDDAIAAYLELGRESGRVVGEDPSRKVITRVPQGDVTVVFVQRSFIERQEVRDVGRILYTDGGQPILYPDTPRTVRTVSDGEPL